MRLITLLSVSLHPLSVAPTTSERGFHAVSEERRQMRPACVVACVLSVAVPSGATEDFRTTAELLEFALVVNHPAGPGVGL